MNKVVAKKIILVSLPVMLVCIWGFKSKDSKIKLPKVMQKQFAFVPQGKVFNGTDTVSVQSFYMSKYEVTNQEYKEFLSALKQQGRTKDFNIAQVDSAKWTKYSGYNAPYVEYYYQHPAYNNYPVVNISIEGAKLYCEWLTKKLNAENPKYDYIIKVKLPNRNEWLSAANGNKVNKTYSWGSPYLRCKGQFLCNFRVVGEENLTFDKKTRKLKVTYYLSDSNFDSGKLSDEADITCDVHQYSPNEFGIFNLNGNVAELVTDRVACGGSWNSLGYDVRNQSTIKYEEPSCIIGFRPILILTKK